MSSSTFTWHVSLTKVFLQSAGNRHVYESSLMRWKIDFMNLRICAGLYSTLFLIVAPPRRVSHGQYSGSPFRYAHRPMVRMDNIISNLDISNEMGHPPSNLRRKFNKAFCPAVRIKSRPTAGTMSPEYLKNKQVWLV
ncbi:hypothetical protein TNCV_2598431 [Trichonephila clavipes]|nr:hypothetical protein TNCV_2598431 [Trichonephila clavipes]